VIEMFELKKKLGTIMLFFLTKFYLHEEILAG